MESYITREEAADCLGVSTRTLDRYVRKKILKSHRRGRRTMFLRLDVESVIETPTPQSHVVSEVQETLPTKQDPDIAALVSLTTKMHHELQQKESEISRLHFQLGKYQEISKNSIPLLEAKNKERIDEKQITTLKREVRSVRSGRFFFFVLSALLLGAVGILSSLLFY